MFEHLLQKLGIAQCCCAVQQSAPISLPHAIAGQMAGYGDEAGRGGTTERERKEKKEEGNEKRSNNMDCRLSSRSSLPRGLASTSVCSASGSISKTDRQTGQHTAHEKKREKERFWNKRFQQKQVSVTSPRPHRDPPVRSAFFSVSSFQFLFSPCHLFERERERGISCPLAFSSPTRYQISPL